MEKTFRILEVSIENSSFKFNISLSLPYNPFHYLHQEPNELAVLQRSCHYRTQSGQHLLSKGHKMSHLVFKINNSQLYNSFFL